MPEINNTFINGINRDISPNKIKNDSYFTLENGTIVGNGNIEKFSIENVIGNKEVIINFFGEELIQSILESYYRIIGYCNIQKDIILFYSAVPLGDGNPLQNTGRIYKLQYVEENTYNMFELYYNKSLFFLPNEKITCWANYENINIQKIYWCTPNGGFKHLNIAPNGDGSLQSHYTDIIATEFNKLSIVGDVQYSKPEFIDYIAGNLVSGVVQYAYRFYNLQGSYTPYSPPSDQIPISEYSDKSSTKNLQGDDINNPGVYSGNGVAINIDLSNGGASELWNTFDRVEVIRLYYNTILAVPTINVIARVPVTQKNLRVIDSGDSLGTIIYEEYLEENLDFTFEDAEVKNNRVFAINTVENNFDVDYDARVYRFYANDGSALSRLAYLYEDGDSVLSPTTIIDGENPSYEIDTTYDVKNLYNSSIDGSSFPFKYQRNGLVLGGSGRNINYRFETSSFLAANLDESGRALNAPIGDSNRDYILGLIRGFQSNETYRFSVKFINKKGKKSFANWIGDIRIPTHADLGVSMSYVQDGKVYLRQIYPVFDFMNLPSDVDGTPLSYQIQYCKREESDRTVLYSGLMGGLVINTELDNDPYQPFYRLSRLDEIIDNQMNGTSRVFSDTDSYPNVLEIVSPDINFNDKSYNPDYFLPIAELEVNSTLWATGDTFTHLTSDWLDDRIDSTSNSIQYVEKIYNWNSLSGFYFNLYESSVRNPSQENDSSYIGSNSTTNYLIRWHADAQESPTHKARKCTSVSSVVEGFVGSYPSKTGKNSYIYGYAMQEAVQYGGSNYEDRLANTYIAAAPINQNKCIWGDTFTCLYDYLRLEHDTEVATGEKMQHIMYFPVETSINLYLRTDNCYSRILDQYFPMERYLIESGMALDENGDQYAALDWSSLYKYNSVHSKSYDVVESYPKPLDFNSQDNFPNIVRWSDNKIPGDELDSWLRFRTNNFNSTRSQYGENTKIEEFLDELIIFQDRAVSLAQIEPQVTVSSDTGAATVLGTGGTLPRFQYLNTEVGLQKKEFRHEVVHSPSALYWIDNYQRKIYMLSGGKVISLSDAKGLEGFTRLALDINSTLVGIYDPKYSKVFLSVKNTTTNTIVVEVTTPAIASINFANVTIGSTLTMDLGSSSGNVFAAGDTTEYPYFAVDLDPSITANNFMTIWNQRISYLGLSTDPTDNTTDYYSSRSGSVVTLTGKEDFNIVLFNNVLTDSVSANSNGGSNIYYFDADGTLAPGQTSYDASNYLVTKNDTTVLVKIPEPGMPDKFDLFIDDSTIDGSEPSSAHAGTVVSATTNTITLAVNASDDDDYYNNKIILFSKSGEDSFEAEIIDYVGSTHVATVNKAMVSPPDNTWTYKFTYRQVACSCVNEHQVTDPTRSSNYGYPEDGNFYSGVDTYNVPAGSLISDYFPCHDNGYATLNPMHTSLLTEAERVWWVGYQNELDGTCTPSLALNYLTSPRIARREAEFLADTGYTAEELGEGSDGILYYRVNYGGYYAPTLKDIAEVSLKGYQLMWYHKADTGHKIRLKVTGVTGGAAETGWRFNLYKISRNIGDMNAVQQEGTFVSYNYYTRSIYDILDCQAVSNVLTVRDSSYFDMVEGGTYSLDQGEFTVNTQTFSTFEGNLSFADAPVDLTRYGLYNNNFTIVYSEPLQQFIEFQSFLPEFYIKEVDGYITSKDKKLLWKHNIGERCKFYGEYKELKLEFYVHVGSIGNVEFNNIKWYSEMYDSDGKLIPNETITSMRVRNAYQQSDEIPLHPIDDDTFEVPTRVYLWTDGVPIPSTLTNYGNLTKVIDHWIAAYPRIIVQDEGIPTTGDYRISDYNQDDYDIYTEGEATRELVSNRFRSPYVKVTMYFTNENNKKLILNDIISVLENKLV